MVKEGELLTRREREVLFYTSHGWTNGRIAEKLDLTENTIKTHKKRINTKLGAKNGIHAVRIALLGGIIK